MADPGRRIRRNRVDKSNRIYRWWMGRLAISRRGALLAYTWTVLATQSLAGTLAGYRADCAVDKLIWRKPSLSWLIAVACERVVRGPPSLYRQPIVQAASWVRSCRSTDVHGSFRNPTA